jgi:hypothetical protein
MTWRFVLDKLPGITTMTDNKKIVRIELTATQKEQVKATIGRDAEAVELTVEELEERVAPALIRNHNETFLVE